MNNYTIKLMNGDKVVITEEEFGKLKGREGNIYIPSVNEIININRIERVFESSKEEEEVELPEYYKRYLAEKNASKN